MSNKLKQIAESTHSVYSPSGAKRYIGCAASTYENMDKKDKKDKDYAIEGTLAHSVGEYVLENATDPLDEYITWLKSKKHDVFASLDSANISDEMIDYIHEYVANVHNISEDYVESRVEEKLDLSNVIGLPGEKGTADCISLMETEEVQVHDLKYGMGVKVYAERNEQLMIYALGAIELFEEDYELEAKQARLVIHQVRRKHLDEWVVSREELEAFKEELQAKVKLANSIRNGDIECKPEHYNPSENVCQWCLSKSTCAALRDSVNKAVFDDFEDMDNPVVKEINDSNLADSLKALPLIKAWVKAVDEHAYIHMMDGNPIEGFKLVLGKSPARTWVDETEALEAMKSMRLPLEQRFKKKVISPAQALKLDLFKKSVKKKNRLAKLIVSGDPKPTIAPATDKRTEYVLTDAFEDLTEEVEEVKVEEVVEEVPEVKETEIIEEVKETEIIEEDFIDFVDLF